MERLIQLWMAHDLIPAQAEDNLDLIGKEIFSQLAWRSFFQDVKQTPPPTDDYGKREQLRCGKKNAGYMILCTMWLCLSWEKNVQP